MFFALNFKTIFFFYNEVPLRLNTGKYFTTKAVCFPICPLGNASIFTKWMYPFNCKRIAILLSHDVHVAVLI